jgi:hypothetical protein
MDPHDLNAAGIDPAAAAMIGGYLAALESGLPTGRRHRARILAEVADGLISTTLANTDAGSMPEDAAREAVIEFGDPRLLATEFARQLGPVCAHRIGVGLVATGPLVGLTWLAASAAQLASLLSAVPPLALILGLTIPAAIVASTGAGWAARRLSVPGQAVTAAAIVASIGCMAGDLSLLLATIAGHGPTAAGPAPMTAVAVTASTLRLSAAAWAGRRVARLRAAAH